jgi:homoserine O-acetyltransferase
MIRLILCGLILMASVVPAVAHGPNQPPHQLYQIGDFKLESGETIRDFAISYVTHGTLTCSIPNGSRRTPRVTSATCAS